MKMTTNAVRKQQLPRSTCKQLIPFEVRAQEVERALASIGCAVTSAGGFNRYIIKTKAA
jgi:hypothetical protein